jgi:hypothetical protein
MSKGDNASLRETISIAVRAAPSSKPAAVRIASTRVEVPANRIARLPRLTGREPSLEVAAAKRFIASGVSLARSELGQITGVLGPRTDFAGEDRPAFVTWYQDQRRTGHRHRGRTGTYRESEQVGVPEESGGIAWSGKDEVQGATPLSLDSSKSRDE